VPGWKELRTTDVSDFQIGDWLAQPSLNRLRSASTERHLEPQVMDLLAFLAATGGRVVSKDEIIDAVWDGRVIAETTLTRSIADLRRALGDDQRSPAYIATIAKRGYRLVAPVSYTFQKCERIADRLASVRQQRFVGREREIEVFRSALGADEPPFAVWHINGPGGVGKTTLIQEFSRLARDAGRRVIHIDGRNIEPTPAGLLLAVSQAIQTSRVDLTDVIAQWPEGSLLFIDTYELLPGMDDWLRDTFFPQLPSRSMAVVAGRVDPASAWRTGVEWGGLTRLSTLGNLRPDEGRIYLTRCGVAAEHQDEALAFTRGHPLALSIVADVLTRGERLSPAQLTHEPEIVRALLQAFVQEVPGRDHRLALHICVTARATTEALIAAVLDRSDVADIFTWLERLPFVEQGPNGLFPHDLARDVLFMDFHWRDPDAAALVMERILGYMYQRLEHAHGLDTQRIWFDVLYVQRYNPCVRPYYEWDGIGTAYAESATAHEREAMIAMVERHEGTRSASIARYWLARQPDAFLAVRSVAGDLLGFFANLCLDRCTPEDIAADPAIARAMAYVERHGPTRPGEHIVYGRFWLDAERHQALTQAFTVTSANWLQRSIAPRTAWSFASMANPDMMEPMFLDLHVWRAREADFEIDGHQYGVFAHDWRVESQQDWLRYKAQRASRVDTASS
jgi:DNA-binding winged helix-turn-helix (wHTH) protein